MTDPQTDADFFTPDDPEDRERLVRDGLMNKVRRTAGRVPFVPDALAAFYCAQDPKTPARVKLALFAALAYFVVPIDAVPDFIAVLGFTDDATIFYATYRLLVGYITDDHRAKANDVLDRNDV